jgi:ketosteroid isomerase-like protein
MLRPWPTVGCVDDVCQAAPVVGALEDRMAAFQRCIEARDRAAAEDVLHAGYALVLVQPARAVMLRARWLEVLPDYVVHSYRVEEQVVDVDGDVAAVVHRVEMAATVLGQERSGLFVISDVWRRDTEAWRVWRRHSTPLRAGPLPGASSPS